MIQSQNASVPETRGAEWPLSGSHMVPSPVLSSSWPSQGPGSSLSTGLGVWKPRKHGIVWAAQTQHLLGSGTFPLQLDFGKYLAGSPRRGLGPLCPHPNKPSSSKMSWRVLGMGTEESHLNTATRPVTGISLPLAHPLSSSETSAARPLAIVETQLQIPKWFPIVQTEFPRLAMHSPHNWQSSPPGSLSNLTCRYLKRHLVALYLRAPTPEIYTFLSSSGLHDYLDTRDDPPHFSREQTTARSLKLTHTGC